MTDLQPHSCNSTTTGRPRWKKWLIIGMVSLPVWFFLAGVYLVDKYLQSGDRNAAGALGTIVAIVGMPMAGASAIAVFVLLAKEVVVVPQGRRKAAAARSLTPEDMRRVEDVARALREADLCDHRTAAAYHARLGAPTGEEPPFEAKYRGVLAKLQAQRPEMTRQQWDEANVVIRRVSLSAWEASSKNPAFTAGRLAGEYPGFSGEFYEWVLASARRFQC